MNEKLEELLNISPDDATKEDNDALIEEIKYYYKKEELNIALHRTLWWEYNQNRDKITNEKARISWWSIVLIGKLFLSSFKYMGLGMLGIFLIIGIVIGAVTILNKIKKK